MMTNLSTKAQTIITIMTAAHTRTIHSKAMVNLINTSQISTSTEMTKVMLTSHNTGINNNNERRNSLDKILPITIRIALRLAPKEINKGISHGVGEEARKAILEAFNNIIKVGEINMEVPEVLITIIIQWMAIKTKSPILVTQIQLTHST
jgi:hypothetical protein